MTETEQTTEYFEVGRTPQIAGLRFRHYRGEEDLPAMLSVIAGSRVEDHDDWLETLEQITSDYRHLVNSDPYRDALLVELDGRLIGYSRVFWLDEAEGNRLLTHFTKLLPEQRGRGIRRAMLRWNEARLAGVRQECAVRSPHDGPVLYQAFANDAETHWSRLLEEAGYRPVRQGYEMVRPDLDAIPDRPLPEGLEVRPVLPEHLPAIWAAMREAFRDHWGFCEDEWGEQAYGGFEEWALKTIDCWQVAWSDGEVAGTVQSFIDDEQNATYGRRRGYTEGICVLRPWRRQGLAKALIARSLHVLRERGMDHAALGVDAENPNGALQLYRSMGFQVVKAFSTYRKAMADRG
jgi:ribosomal protein S18 acetylase RimI-like enzyme